MRYLGPPVMKKIIRQMYDGISRNYARADGEEPTIVVGPIGRIIAKDGRMAVSQDQRAISEANDIITTVRDCVISSRVGMKYGVPVQSMSQEKLLRKLARLREVGEEPTLRHSTASYHEVSDVTILSLVGVLGLFTCDLIDLDIGSNEYRSLASYVGSLKHELVHWDLADTSPYREFRGLAWDIFAGGEVPFNNMDGRDNYGLWSKDEVRKMREVLESGDGKENDDPKIAATFECKLKMIELGFHTLGEAAAYAVEGFEESGFNGTSDNTEEFLATFRRLRGNITAHGIRETLSKVKTYIEESWKEKKNVLEVLNAAV